MRPEEEFKTEISLLRQSNYFDADYYYRERPDVKNAGVDAAYHYFFQGWKERANPSDKFCTAMYLSENAAKICPLVDYERNGCQGDYSFRGALDDEIANYHYYRRYQLPWNSTACYTYISKGYDSLISHRHIVYDWDYICFTDDDDLIKQRYVGIWKIRPALERRFDAKRNSGWHKTHPEKCCRFYKNSVWIDGNVNVISPHLYREILMRNSVILVPEHYERDCIYDECEKIRELGCDSAENCDAAIEFLRRENMPQHYGLNETNIVFREHDSHLVRKVDEIWWKCIKKYSKRDQASFSYALFKNRIYPQRIALLNTRTNSGDFLVIKHTKSKTETL